MVRLGPLFALTACVGTLAAPAPAEPPASTQVARTLAVQRAMLTARDYLARGHAREAVETLEAELLSVNGNSAYLALLREAYGAYLKDLERQGGDPAKLESLRRHARILGTQSDVEKTIAAASPPALPPPEPTPGAAPPSEAPPPPPEPAAAPAQPAPAATPGQPEPAAPVKPVESDPFQQEPADRAGGTAIKARAVAAFEGKKFAQADKLFAEATRAHADLTAEERAAWGYCKLHGLALRLNKTGDNTLSPAVMEQEARLAAELGGGRLDAFSKQIMAEIRKRKQPGTADARAPTAAAAVPEGWQATETANFRVLHRQNADAAAEAGRVAEAARSAMFDRWSGHVPGNWSPRCDIWVHPAAEDYSRATEKPAHSPGHSTVGVQGGKVVSRRIDLRADDADMLDVNVPHEVTYLVLADLFADQPLPRWAEVAMTVLAEPPGQVSRYLRAVPRCAQEQKLLPVGQLLNMQEFPKDKALTAFYVESVSVTDYLVHLKGAKAFALFLREAPRRGFDKALQTHYGFKDSADLQDKWLKYAYGNK